MMRKLTKTRYNQEGFTITELVITIAVIGLLAVSVVQLFGGIQSVQQQTDHLETARRSAEHQIESLRNLNYNALPPDETIDFTAELPDSLPGPKQGTVAVTEDAPGLKRVDVTVQYRFGGEQKEVVLSSTLGVLGITQ